MCYFYKKNEKKETFFGINDNFFQVFPFAYICINTD